LNALVQTHTFFPTDRQTFNTTERFFPFSQLKCSVQTSPNSLFKMKTFFSFFFLNFLFCRFPCQKSVCRDEETNELVLGEQWTRLNGKYWEKRFYEISFIEMKNKTKQKKLLWNENSCYLATTTTTTSTKTVKINSINDRTENYKLNGKIKRKKILNK
jgi:hypothetical protein